MTETPTMQDESVEQKPAFVDYWGTDERHKHMLPDGVQFLEFKIMAEGDKVKFQKMTNQDLTIGRDNTAKVKVDPATERHQLIHTSLTGWYLFKDGEPLLFSRFNLEKWLEVAPPKIIEELELAIRKANPWMQADMTVKQIDEEMERLEEMRKTAKEREAGEDGSKSRSSSS